MIQFVSIKSDTYITNSNRNQIILAGFVYPTMQMGSHIFQIIFFNLTIRKWIPNKWAKKVNSEIEIEMSSKVTDVFFCLCLKLEGTNPLWTFACIFVCVSYKSHIFFIDNYVKCIFYI